jgi:hypothetical protein
MLSVALRLPWTCALMKAKVIDGKWQEGRAINSFGTRSAGRAHDLVPQVSNRFKLWVGRYSMVCSNKKKEITLETREIPGN